MATKRQIADDLFKYHGALVSISDIKIHYKISRAKAREITVGLQPFGENTGKRYFYEDIAEKILQM